MSRFNLSEEYWRTKDGKVLSISKMEDSHIKNAIRYFSDKRDPQYLATWRSFQGLVKESIKRGIDVRSEWDA